MTNYEPDMNHRIWQVVALIPRGRVSTYGHVAEKAGLAGAARRVGSALRALPADSKVPWHRVLNSRGDDRITHGHPDHIRSNVTDWRPKGCYSAPKAGSTLSVLVGSTAYWRALR